MKEQSALRLGAAGLAAAALLLAAFISLQFLPMADMAKEFGIPAGVAGRGLDRPHERLTQLSTGIRKKVALALTLARPTGLARVVVIVSHIPDIVKPLLPSHVRLPEGVLS